MTLLSRTLFCMALAIVGCLVACGDAGLRVVWIDNRAPSDVVVHILDGPTGETTWRRVRAGGHGYVAFAPAQEGRFDIFSLACEPVGSSSWTETAGAGITIDTDYSVHATHVPPYPAGGDASVDQITTGCTLAQPST